MAGPARHEFQVRIPLGEFVGAHLNPEQQFEVRRKCVWGKVSLFKEVGHLIVAHHVVGKLLQSRAVLDEYDGITTLGSQPAICSIACCLFRKLPSVVCDARFSN